MDNYENGFYEIAKTGRYEVASWALTTVGNNKNKEKEEEEGENTKKKQTVVAAIYLWSWSGNKMTYKLFEGPYGS